MSVKSSEAALVQVGEPDSVGNALPHHMLTVPQMASMSLARLAMKTVASYRFA